jgi:aquaporin Z
MISACVFTALLEYPSSPVHAFISSPLLRRYLMGLAMGATAAGIIYSRPGKRSGAHMNPAATLAFLSLGRITALDACFYVVAQIAGGIAGTAIASGLLGRSIAHPAVHYAITMPGKQGLVAAAAAEFVISFLLISVVLRANASPRYMRFTGVWAAVLVATYIAVEAPISGMSMTPARSLASAFWPGEWKGLWIYFVAPPGGMLAAAQLFRATRGNEGCAKFVHDLRLPASSAAISRAKRIHRFLRRPLQHPASPRLGYPAKQTQEGSDGIEQALRRDRDRHRRRRWNAGMAARSLGQTHSAH